MRRFRCVNVATWMAVISLLVTACGRHAGAGDDVAATASVAEQPSPPISVVTDFNGDVPCYSVVEESGSVVIPKVCPVVDVPSDVWFVASSPWADGAVTLVYVAPGLAVNSSQRFSRDEEFGWTAFITEPDGVARFTLQSGDNTVNCSVSVMAVDCA